METPDRLDRWIPRLMTVTVLAVAVFAFVQSYTHVYYLGQTHHQTGASLRMLPLSVDWLMFAAGLVRLHLSRKGVRHWFPLWGLALGAIATLIANIASGIIWGWETAAIQAWAPIVLFVVVELGMLLVRTAKAKGVSDAGSMGLPGSASDPGRDRGRAGPDPATGQLPHPAMALTELRQPSQPAPDPGPETQAIPAVPGAVTGSPGDTLEGWGQLGGLAADQQQLAGDQGRLAGDQNRLNGIGLRNGSR